MSDYQFAPVEFDIDTSLDKDIKQWSTHIRSVAWEKTLEAITIDREHLDRYEIFLARTYEETLRKELNVRSRKGGKDVSGVGFDTGKLSKNLRAVSELTTRRQFKEGRVNLNFKLDITSEEYEEYGEYLNNERSGAFVPYNVILRWVKRKQKRGVFKIDPSGKLADKSKPRKGVIRGSKEKKLESVVWGIVKKAATTNRPAVLKDWSNMEMNTRLRRRFFSDIQKKGKKYRDRIRRGISKQITSRNKV
jgi:hypothetical protein